MSAKTKPSPPTKKRGRPSKFSEATAAAIAMRLSKGEPMAEICRSPRMPSVSTVHEWMKADDAFSGSIARARKDGFDVIAADCLKIADTPKTGKIVKRSPDGTTETIEDMLGHRKLQIDTRLKLLAKWDPKRYGDKQEITHGVTEDMALVMKRIRQRREN